MFAVCAWMQIAVTHPVNFPCGKKLEYQEKTHDFRRSVDVLLFSHEDLFQVALRKFSLRFEPTTLEMKGKCDHANVIKCHAKDLELSTSEKRIYIFVCEFTRLHLSETQNRRQNCQCEPGFNSFFLPIDRQTQTRNPWMQVKKNPLGRVNKVCEGELRTKK
jgi:hypothetical protein